MFVKLAPGANLIPVGAARSCCASNVTLTIDDRNGIAQEPVVTPSWKNAQPDETTKYFPFSN
jgi:hypothetical protein